MDNKTGTCRARANSATLRGHNSTRVVFRLVQDLWCQKQWVVGFGHYLLPLLKPLCYLYHTQPTELITFFGSIYTVLHCFVYQSRKYDNLADFFNAIILINLPHLLAEATLPSTLISYTGTSKCTRGFWF